MKPSRILRTLLRAGITAAVLIPLAACAAPTPAPTLAPAPPTLDPAVIAGMAVQTMEARLTQSALDNPSPTPPPTATPPPTSTPEPTATPTSALTATATGEPEQVNGLAAKLLYVTTYPENKREYLSNEKFGLAFGFKNIGSIPWSPGYKVVLLRFTGELTAPFEAALGTTVEAGEKAEFNLQAFGSEMVSEHTWVYQLVNEAGGAVPGGTAVFTYRSNP